MAFYPDLARYVARRKIFRIGWLDCRYDFDKAQPAKWMIEKLWRYCGCYLLQAYGFHECNLADCSGPAKRINFGRYPTLSELQERYEFLKKSFRTPAYKGLSKACKLQLLGNFEDGIKSRLRGYSRMILGAHPRNGEEIKLGFAEIIVFGEGGKIYVAPNMVYHYVTVHHYKPPEEFIQALKHGPCPPDPEYIERLIDMGFSRIYVKAYQETWPTGKEKKASQKRKSS